MEVQNTRTLAVLEQALTDTHTKPTGDPHVHDWPQTAAVKLVKERSRGQVRPPPPPPPPPPLHHHLLLHLLLHLLHHLKLIFTSASRPSCSSSPSRCRAWAGRKARRGSRATRSPCSSRARSRGRSSATRSGSRTATPALMSATQGSNPGRADFARDHNPHVAALRTGLLLTRVEPRPGQEHVHFATVLVVDAAVLPGGPAATLFLQLCQQPQRLRPHAAPPAREHGVGVGRRVRRRGRVQRRQPLQELQRSPPLAGLRAPLQARAVRPSRQAGRRGCDRDVLDRRQRRSSCCGRAIPHALLEEGAALRGLRHLGRGRCVVGREISQSNSEGNSTARLAYLFDRRADR